MKPPNSGYPKQRKYLEQRTNCLVPNVTVFVKLFPGSGYHLITGKFFKTRRCSLFRGFTVLLLLLVVAVIVAVLAAVLSLLLSLAVALMIYQYYFPYQLLFLSLFYNQYTPSVFVLSLPSHLMKKFFATVFNFSEFILVYVANIKFICDVEIYLLTHLLTYLLIYLLTYLLPYLLAYLLFLFLMLMSRSVSHHAL